jgi:hypothetical protein
MKGSDRIVVADWIGTAVFAVSAIGATVWPALELVAIVVALALFGVGIVVFFWAYAVAIGRSRKDEIGIGGLFFLAGSVAPPDKRRALLGALAAQVVVGLGAAVARPFTSLAFGVLSPLFGLAMAGLWGSRHGSFGARTRPR